MRWITKFGIMHLSGVYYIFFFTIGYSFLIKNILLCMALGLITSIVFDYVVSILYNLKIVNNGDHYTVIYDKSKELPDFPALFITAILSAIIWAYGSYIMGLIAPIIIVFIGKLLWGMMYEKLEG